MKKSKQSLNKTIAKKDLLNSISALSAFLIWVFGIVMFLLVLGPEQDGNGNFFFSVKDRLMYSDGSYRFSADQENGSLISIIGGLALGLSQFEFLHRKKYASTLLSFGVKRNKLFLNRLILPLVLALFCIIFPFLITLKMNIDTFGLKADIFPWFFFLLSRYIRIFITSYTISVVACVFTGRTIEAIAGAVSIAALPCSLVALMDTVFDSLLFGYAGTYYSQTVDNILKADPIYISSLMFSWGSTYAIYYPKNTPLDKDSIMQLIFSVIWIIISFGVLWFIKNYFAKKYKPENSGFKGINKGMVTVISFTIPLFVGAITINILDGYFSPTISNSINLLIICISTIVGVLASIVCGFIIHFTFKKTKTALIGGLAVTGTICLSVILGITGFFGAYHNTPKAEEIERIEISAPFKEFLPEETGYSDFSQQYVRDSSTILVITEKKDIETVLELHQKASEKEQNTSSSRFEVTYIFDDGSYLVRDYKFLGEEATKEVIKLWDTEAAKTIYKNCLFHETEKADIKNNYFTLLFKGYYEQPFIKEYNAKDTYLNITTKDGQVKSVLDEITEAEFTKLKKALYKDICELSSSQWFTPAEAQIGTLSFDISSYQNHTSELNFYITSDMINTIKALKDIDLYKHFECKKKIDTVFVADIKEYITWENLSFFSLNKKDISVHQPFFTYKNDDLSYAFFDSEGKDGYTPPVKKVKDKMQIKSLTQKGYIAYNILNDGQIVFVNYTDGSCSSYVIPYDK